MNLDHSTDDSMILKIKKKGKQKRRYVMNQAREIESDKSSSQRE